MREKMKTIAIVTSSVLIVGILYIYNNTHMTTPTSIEKEPNIETSETTNDNANKEEITISEESIENKEKSDSGKIVNDKNKENIEKDSKGNLIFKSNLGFSMTFPDTWKDKYRIIEESNSVAVYFKSSDSSIDPKSGLFFLIIKQDDSLDPSMFDTIDVENYVTVNDDTYFIGGPTDISLNENASDFNTFISMNKDRKDIIESIVSLK
ncbi:MULTISPECIES: hypothetical protein [Clostridium]|uniref:DUF4367 domain-containing protein n=1 Tax=Clostridium aquiflavi TaxID=3073603 RepID=A0ABU1EKB7_9CLOT|nr:MULTISPECIES: hypothetical protein [unclassified Clostridium]MDR5588608.1 hypothetical protein [Clostridium sp. 5N-1]NFG63233.1 hypothetical protein [Clostridium botulinum]NFQ11068.1 hypothetical protein [Clostridium botulinum]